MLRKILSSIVIVSLGALVVTWVLFVTGAAWILNKILG